MPPFDSSWPTLFTAPTTITVNFNDDVLATSLQAADLTVDGIPATAVTLSTTTGNQAVFTVPAGVSGPGTHTFAITAGAVLDVQNTPVTAFSGTYIIDNVAPRVTATSLAPNSVIAPGSLTYQVTFSEAMKTANLTSDDFTLHGNFRQAVGINYTPGSFSYNPAGTVVTLNYTSLPDDNYTLTLIAGVSSGTISRMRLAILSTVNSPGPSCRATASPAETSLSVSAWTPGRRHILRRWQRSFRWEP